MTGNSTDTLWMIAVDRDSVAENEVGVPPYSPGSLLNNAPHDVAEMRRTLLRSGEESAPPVRDPVGDTPNHDHPSQGGDERDNSGNLGTPCVAFCNPLFNADKMSARAVHIAEISLPVRRSIAHRFWSLVERRGGCEQYCLRSQGLWTQSSGVLATVKSRQAR